MSQEPPVDTSRRSVAVRVWDALIWITVLFPLLTGGVWIRRPGLKVELTEVTIPIVILAIWAACLLYRNHGALNDASSARLISRIWRAWRCHLENHPTRTLSLSLLFFGTLWAWVAVARHWAFLSGYADLGIFVNGIWNLTHGNGYVSSVKTGLNLFADHQSPIFWLLAPIFWLIPRPETLLVSQAFGLCSGAIALYLIGRQYLSKQSPYLALLPLAYWFFNPLRNANRFDFHPEVFLLPCFLFGIWGLQESKTKWRIFGALFTVLALMGKESSGPVLAGIGLAWIMGAAPPVSRKRCRIWGCLAILTGVAHFYFCTQIVPTFFAGKYLYQGDFAVLGNSLTELALSPFTKPGVFFPLLFRPPTLRFLAGTLAPLAFLPLLAPRAFLAAVPGYLIYFLSENPHRINIGYHYAIESSVGVLWAFAVALGRLENKKFLPALPRWPLLPLITCCLLAAYGRSEIHYIRFYKATPHYQWIEKNVLPALNTEASFATTGVLLPHMANRPWVHHLPVLEIPGKGYVDCVLWARHPEVNQTPMTDEWNQLVIRKMRDNNFQEVWSCKSLTIYQNPAYKGACLTLPPDCGP